jgi:hypothetical protein
MYQIIKTGKQGLDGIDLFQLKSAISTEMDHFAERFSSFLFLFKRGITHKDLRTSNIFETAVLGSSILRTLGLGLKAFEVIR